MTLEEMSCFVGYLADRCRLRDGSDGDATIVLKAQEAQDLREVGNALGVLHHWGAAGMVRRAMEKWKTADNRRRGRSGKPVSPGAPGSADMPRETRA